MWSEPQTPPPKTKNKPTVSEPFCQKEKVSLFLLKIRSAAADCTNFFAGRALLFSPSVCSRVEFSSRFFAQSELVKRLLLDEVALSITRVFSTPLG